MRRVVNVLKRAKIQTILQADLQKATRELHTLANAKGKIYFLPFSVFDFWDAGYCALVCCRLCRLFPHTNCLLSVRPSPLHWWFAHSFPRPHPQPTPPWTALATILPAPVSALWPTASSPSRTATSSACSPPPTRRSWTWPPSSPPRAPRTSSAASPASKRFLVYLLLLFFTPTTTRYASRVLQCTRLYK